MATLGFMMDYATQRTLGAVDDERGQDKKPSKGFVGFKAVEGAKFLGANKAGILDDDIFELLSGKGD